MQSLNCLEEGLLHAHQKDALEALAEAFKRSNYRFLHSTRYRGWYKCHILGMNRRSHRHTKMLSDEVATACTTYLDAFWRGDVGYSYMDDDVTIVMGTTANTELSSCLCIMFMVTVMIIGGGWGWYAC